jgi:p-cumate 2,3-dioxygenase subunit beta
MNGTKEMKRTDTLARRQQLQWEVQEFLFTEAALLDDWLIDEWLELFTDECRYEIAPTGIREGFSLSPQENFFYVVDDRQRLEQRVLRLHKPNAHVEYPHSRTRHLYSNVRVVAEDGDMLTAMASFATYRTKHRETQVYPGSARYLLLRTGEGLRIKEKRVVLDLDALIPQGKLSILL